MKLDNKNKKIQYPNGLLTTKVRVFNRKHLGQLYHANVDESTKSIRSLFTRIDEKPPSYQSLYLLTDEIKTAIIYHCEMLSSEFSNTHSSGVIMKACQTSFEEQGYIGIPSNSQWRCAINDVEKNLCTIPYGLKITLLPLYHNDDREREPCSDRGLIPVNGLKLPVSIGSLSSGSMKRNRETSKIPTTYEQHLHLSKIALHYFLHNYGTNLSLSSCDLSYISILVNKCCMFFIIQMHQLYQFFLNQSITWQKISLQMNYMCCSTHFQKYYGHYIGMNGGIILFLF